MLCYVTSVVILTPFLSTRYGALKLFIIPNCTCSCSLTFRKAFLLVKWCFRPIFDNPTIDSNAKTLCLLSAQREAKNQFSATYGDASEQYSFYSLFFIDFNQFFVALLDQSLNNALLNYLVLQRFPGICHLGPLDPCLVNCMGNNFGFDEIF